MDAPVAVATPASGDFATWEVCKDVVDELIDISLNYRQSGHPGGSRSKVHLLLSLMLSGAMRWDARRPWRALQDRFVLSAGHTVPVVYAALAVLNEILDLRHESDPGAGCEAPDRGRWALRPLDLLSLRRRGGLPGHAEMAGKTLFLKYNTGPSGHGLAPAAGMALALRALGQPRLRVFCVDGEGGLTTGAAHETKNSAWGLGLANLVMLIDWNDFGIDERPASSVVAGSPQSWFEPYGWRVLGTPSGMEWGPVTHTLNRVVTESSDVPTAAWFATTKGRGYGKVDAASHGSPWPANSEQFWQARESFARRYDVKYDQFGAAAPQHADERHLQAVSHVRTAVSVLQDSAGLVREVSDRLLALAKSVDDVAEPASRAHGAIYRDPDLLDAARYPGGLTKASGELVSNRAALSDWGAYVNALGKDRYGRPAFLACAADLAESTGVAGFAKSFKGRTTPGWGWYDRSTNPDGAVLPQEITEFSNAGLMTGLASVNLASDPFEEFEGLWGVCSTYGSFSYLKYGPLRLFSQLAQDSEMRVGRVMFVAGHSGFETADDSRTHFGIYEPGIMELFPRFHVVNLHPWEYNEVPVMLAAALSTDVPIIVLHLTRPAIRLPDRAALGMDSHVDAANGAYLIVRPGPEEPSGTVVVRGTATTNAVVELLPTIQAEGLNLKIVAATSWELFERQPLEVRDRIMSPHERAHAMVISNASLRFMEQWHDNPRAADYSLSPDWDDRWRTGGTVDEVAAEAHLSAEHILHGLRRYAGRTEEHAGCR